MKEDSPPLRVAVVTPVIGLASEVWILRQCLDFNRFTPVLMGWEKRDEWPAHDVIEERTIPGSFDLPRTLPRRIMRKLGMRQGLKPYNEDTRFLRDSIQAANVDAVLCHFAWTAIPVVEALSKEMPLVLHVHGRDVSALMKSWAYRNALKRVLARTQALITVGAHQIERLRPLGLPRQTRVIPCGAPLDLFAALPIPDQTTKTPVQFISIGRMSPEKGMMECLQAFERIADEVPTSRLVLVGSGPDYPAVAAKAAGSPFAARIRLTGRLEPAQVAEELASSHVYMQHSLCVGGSVEGFGVTLTEAGAVGLPLVASAVGGLLEQIAEGENGFLFPEGDVSAQAAVMRRLADDADLRRRLGTRARTLASRFDSSKMTQELEIEILSAIRRGV